MKDVLTLLQSWPYAVWAAGLACAFGYVVAKGSAHLNADNRARLSLYLQGDYRMNWAENFCDLFDGIFGERHFSRKTFLRSAIASVIAVAALYTLFGPILGLMDARADSTFTLLAVLGLGALINIIPDYLSLWETRAMLHLFRNVRNPILQAGVLILDLAFSAAIIWFGITAYFWIQGEESLHLVNMAGLYSPFAIFFYSTFLTSLWAWVYCLTSWFVKAFTALGLNEMLDVTDKRAGNTLAFIGGLTIFAGALLAQPVTKMDARMIDDQLCTWFPAVACVHGARLSADDAEKLAYLTKACAGGWEDCYDEADSRYGIKDEEAVRLWRAGCDAGDARSCTDLGYMYQSAYGVDQDYERAVSLFRQGCDGGHALGCTNLGVMYLYALGVDQDDARAVSLFRQGCNGGDALGCTNLGFMYESAFGVEQDYARAVSLYRQGCDGGHARGCNNLGLMHRNGDGVSVDHEKAFALFGQACDGGHGNGCARSGWYLEHGEAVEKDLKAAEVFYIKACDLGDDWACGKMESFAEMPK